MLEESFRDEHADRRAPVQFAAKPEDAVAVLEENLRPLLAFERNTVGPLKTCRNKPYV